jgi:uncharacterized membrane protein
MSDFFGIPIPNAGPVFLVALVFHIIAGLVAVVAGAGAMLARKGASWHLRFGRIYLAGISVLFVTMLVLAVIRWPLDNHLVALGVIATAAAFSGFANRRRHGMDRWHIIAMGVSYIAMLTAFYVDNGPHLPLWELLPGWAFWIVPALVGIPLITWAIVRRDGARHRARPREVRHR